MATHVTHPTVRLASGAGTWRAKVARPGAGAKTMAWKISIVAL